MTSISVRLLIVDQSLRDMAGHHYEYDVALFRAAAAAGVPTVIGAHASVQPLEFLGGNVRAWFQRAWYEAQGSQPAAVEPLRRSLFERARARVRRLLGRRVVDHERAPATGPTRSSFGEEVHQLIHAERFTADDHLLVHTFSIPEFDSLIDMVANQESLPLIHIVFRRDAEEPSVADGPTGGVTASLRRLMSSRSAIRTLRLYADTDDLARQYGELVPGLTVGIVPIPHCLPSREATATIRKPGPLRIVYLGDARDEKGFHLLADVVDTLAKRLFPSGRGRFVFQANVSVAGDSMAQASARRRLAAYSPSEVELITEELPISTFHDLLNDADIVVLPYDSASYARRSSGILAQALAAGRVVIVPAGTWMARQVHPSASLLFAEGGLAAAVEAAVEGWDELSRAAQDRAAQWRAEHDPEKFLAQLLGARRQTKIS
jgi:glycosyltransferase involved in cell wall biosynthesis